LGDCWFHWAVFYNYEAAHIFELLFAAAKKLCSNFQKNGLGCILGDFKTNSSGTDVLVF
jgi:hypothetical protein